MEIVDQNYYSDHNIYDSLVPLLQSFNDNFHRDGGNLSEIFTTTSSLVPLVSHDHFNSDDVIDAVPLNSVKMNDPVASSLDSSGGNANIGSNNVRYKEKGVPTERKRAANANSKLGDMGLDELRSYFYMPITKAANEMNVGLTLLKKRCRELGIPRWPHRKMKSLNTLIHNVRALGEESNEECVRRELVSLEGDKKLMEENPRVELTERTKKLRQAWFKASYKRRRLMQDPYFDPRTNFLC